MNLSNSQYNCIKWIVLTVLPGIAVAFAGMGAEFHWTWVGSAIVVINALDVFIGTITGISSHKYNILEEK